MIQIKFGYLPLSFIASDEEVRRQVKNTIICRYVLDKFKNPQKLLKFLKSTQYGFTASAQDTGENKLLRISDIKNGIVNWETVPYCNCEREEDYLLQVNDILIARTGGTTGKSFIIKQIVGKPVFASYLIGLRVNEKLNPDYLYLFLNSYAYWSQIAQMKKGSAQPNVNAERIKELLIPYCDLKIQDKLVALANDQGIDDEFVQLYEKINEALERVDLTNELKIKYDEQNEFLSKLRQAILQEAVQGKLVPRDPADKPASELLKRIKADKLQLMWDKKIKEEKPLPPISPDEVPYELPKGWVWCRLPDIVAFGKNSIKRGPFGSSIRKEFFVTKGYKVYEQKNAIFNNFSLGNYYIDELMFQRLEDFEVKPNDIIISCSGTIGKVAVAPHDIRRGIINQALLKLTLNTNIVLNEYFAILFNAFIMQSDTLTNLKGTAIKNITSVQVLKQIPFPLPPLNEQKRIVAKVDELLKLCDELEEQIRQSTEESERLMQAVLREAFEGKYSEGPDQEASAA